MQIRQALHYCNPVLIRRELLQKLSSASAFTSQRTRPLSSYMVTTATVLWLPPFISHPPSLTHPNILNLGTKYVSERSHNEKLLDPRKNKIQNRIELHANELYSM